MDLEAYKRIVSRLSDSKSDVVFYNTGIEHANIVMKNIFEHSKKNLNILTGTLNSIVYSNNETIFYLEKFFLDGGNLNVIFDDINNIDRNTEIIKLCKKYSLNVTSKTIPSTLGFHYLTCDKKMFRYEYDIYNYKAEFSFNSVDKVLEFDSHFQTIFNNSTLVTL